MREPGCFYDGCPACSRWLDFLDGGKDFAPRYLLRCAICKEYLTHPAHTTKAIADHMRAELVRRGYPDPWREK